MQINRRPIEELDNSLIIQPPSVLRCCLLGEFLISRGKRILTAKQIRLRKARDLLKLLALAPDRKLHKEQLMELLWPDCSPEAASHNLSQTLYHLRPLLTDLDPSAQILFEDENLALRANGGIFSDVEDFEQAAHLALSQADRRSSRMAAACQDAIVMYTGDLLPEDGPSTFFYRRRDDLRNLYLELLLKLAGYNLEVEEYIPAIDTLQKAIEIDPANEDAHTCLMRAYALNGQRQAALRQYQALQEALQSDLEVEPALESKLLYEQILKGGLAPRQTSFEWLFQPQHNLPALISSFIGRENEQIEVRRLVQAHRMVTLMGAGGVGKTRLAIKAAESLLGEFQQGVFWVDLAVVSNPDLVAAAVLTAFRLPLQERRPDLERLADFLRHRRALLLLDNCEHLSASCAYLAEVLLKGCPDLHILTTSRVRLNVPGEIAFRVPGLEVPDSAKSHGAVEIAQYDAVSLFTERSGLYVPGFTLNEENSAAVAHICQRLDGIPLALELAAARSRMLTVQQISDQLDDVFRLLVGGSQAVLPRHRTLRSSIEWSYTLLPRAERLLLQRLSVFSGGWSLEAAEIVCAGEGIQQTEVMDFLGALVDHSLVAAETLPGVEARYYLLETVRQYALEQLQGSGSENLLFQRHLEYYLRLAEQADQGIRGPQAPVWIKRLDGERSNLFSAMERSLNSPLKTEMGVRLACALAWYWGVVGDFVSAQHFLLKAIIQSADFERTPIRAAILFHASSLSSCGGSFMSEQDMLANIEESLEIWHEQQNNYPLEEAQCRTVLGWIRKSRFADAQGMAMMKECMRIFHDLGNLWWEAWTYNLISMEQVKDEAFEADETFYTINQRETTLWRKTNDRWGGTIPVVDRGDYAFKHGDFVEAQSCFLKSLAIFEEFGSKGMAFQMLRDLGHVARALGEYDQAEIYYQTCERLALEIGWERWLPIINLGRGFVALHQKDDTRASKYFEDALRSAQKLDKMGVILVCIASFAALAVTRRKPPIAASLFGAATALMHARQIKANPVDQLEIGHFLELCRTQCEKEVFDRAWASGSLMTLEQAVNCALELAC